MGSSASLIGAGAIEGDFKHYSGSTIALNHTNEARFGDDKTLIQWVNPYTLLLFPEDDYEVQLFVYNGIKDALVCVVSKFGKRAMLQAYEESELYTRVKGMFESAPKVPMSKQVSGHFRGLFVHDIKTSDPIIHGEPAKVQWLNPCCFRTEKGGKRAPELWVYHKAADTFLQVVVCDHPVADARSDPRRKHKRLTAAEIAEVEKNGMGKEDEGIDLLATAAGAADQAPETAAMSKTAEPVIKARQVSPMEEPGADGKFTVVIEGRFSGTDGDEIRVKSNSIKKGGQKAKIDWISPYAFSYAPDGDDESQHLFIYSFDYNGFYEVTQAADSVALTYGGTHFYTRTEGEAPLELMMIERQWGPFERLHIPEEEGQPLILEGVEYKFDWLNPFSFHINVDGEDQIFTYCVEQTAFLQLGAWEQPVWSARSKFEHMMLKLDPSQAPVPVVKRKQDADDGEGEDEDGEDDDEEDEEEDG